MWFRTAFILVGEVMATEKVDDDGKISLHISRPGGEKFDGEKYKDTEEDFEVYTLNAQAVDGLNEGDIINLTFKDYPLMGEKRDFIFIGEGYYLRLQ